MLGIIILLLLSQLLLKLTLRKSISVLNLRLNKENILHLFLGFILSSAFVIVLYLCIATAVQNPYKINPGYTTGNLFQALWYIFKAVATEELFFRGAILYILSNRIGPQKAITLSALSFGIYHVYAHGVSEPFKAIEVIVSTGFVGYALAYSYIKTKTLLAPFALHFGHNVIAMIVFSSQKNIGIQLFTKTYITDPHIPNQYVGLLLLVLYYTGLPLLVLIYTKRSWHVSKKIAHTSS